MVTVKKLHVVCDFNTDKQLFEFPVCFPVEGSSPKWGILLQERAGSIYNEGINENSGFTSPGSVPFHLKCLSHHCILSESANFKPS